MESQIILGIYIVLKSLQQSLERGLFVMNRTFYMNPEKQTEARDLLKLEQSDLSKTLTYTEDKYRFGQFSSWIGFFVTLAFIALGGLGLVEQWARQLAGIWNAGEIIIGLTFFAIIGLLGFLFELPFDYYRIFTIEERHGFNKQTPRLFFIDQIKGLVLGAVLGGILLSLILLVMNTTEYWWIIAWALVSAFTLLTSWIYPVLLAPLFNKFTPLEEGSLKAKIERLAQKIEFRTDGIYIMDASRRSSHGNAYFTGLFGKKRIVLFDTLVKDLSEDQVTAVLAHELGHFKLHHVRWAMIRGVVFSGLLFYLLSMVAKQPVVYEAFFMEPLTPYGALVVFSLLFSLFSLLLQPIGNFISRKNEFAADRFALAHIENKRELADALLKLREQSHSMPISHPIFSAVYHSHPPMIERLKAMAYFERA